MNTMIRIVAALSIGLAALSSTAQAIDIIEFSIPTSGNSGNPYEITVGPDGNLWFTETFLSGNAQIGRINPAGVITMFQIMTESNGITSGPDGNIWFDVC